MFSIEWEKRGPEAWITETKDGHVVVVELSPIGSYRILSTKDPDLYSMRFDDADDAKAVAAVKHGRIDEGWYRREPI